MHAVVSQYITFFVQLYNPFYYIGIRRHTDLNKYRVCFYICGLTGLYILYLYGLYPTSSLDL